MRWESKKKLVFQRARCVARTHQRRPMARSSGLSVAPSMGSMGDQTHLPVMSVRPADASASDPQVIATDAWLGEFRYGADTSLIAAYVLPRDFKCAWIALPHDGLWLLMRNFLIQTDPDGNASFVS